MADFPLFAFTSQEDWYGELQILSAEAGNAPVSLAGRTFEMPITPATQGGIGAAAVDPAKTLTMAAGGGLTFKTDGADGTLIFRVARTVAQAFQRGEYTADLLEVVSGERHVFLPVRIRFSEPAGLLTFIARSLGAAVTFASRQQPIVTPLAIAGRQGTPGATIITGTAPPVPADGRDNDFFIEDRTASNLGRRMYGPKAGGAWPPTPWTIQVARYQDVPGLSDALGAKADKTALQATQDATAQALIGKMPLAPPTYADLTDAAGKMQDGTITIAVVGGRATLLWRSGSTVTDLLAIPNG